MSSGARLRYPLTSLTALFPWYWGPCPFKASKKHSLFFVTGVSASGPAHRSCCSVSLVSSHPCMHCVCTLVWVAGAVCLAVLGSLSLPPGAAGRCAGVPPAGAYILPTSRGAGFLQVWMWSGCFPVSSVLYFRKSFLLYFHSSTCFWELISTALLMPPSWLHPF